MDGMTRSKAIPTKEGAAPMTLDAFVYQSFNGIEMEKKSF